VREDVVGNPTDVVPVSYARRCADLAAAHPDRVALRVAARDGSVTTLTWQELEARSNQAARALQERGLGLGDRIALGLPNSVELVLAVLGSWKVGATPIVLRWDLPEWEQARVLEVIDPKLHLPEDDRAWVAATTDRSSDPVPEVVAPQTHGICSSGSTGTPKVIIAERPGTWVPTVGAPFPADWIDVPRPQRVVVPAPLYHTNGFMTLYNLVSGDELIILEKFDAALVIDLVERFRATAFSATPTMLQRMADLPDIEARDLSSIVWVLQGAAVISPNLVRRWIELLGGQRFFMAYGMTENLGTTSLSGEEWLAHPGSVGRGYRGTQVRILDEDGRDLPAGEVGDIYLYSPASIAYTYLGDAGRLQATDDGFTTAGDVGFLDEDGYLHIADRRVDMVVTGGANVFPAEVESALIEHPGIADVVVIGLADPEWGRRVHAIIQAADPADPPSEADVIAFAKTKLASYKAPKTVELVDRIPRSEATKVSRGALVAERGG
jgi:bile acid-coenzyme A ligase